MPFWRRRSISWPRSLSQVSSKDLTIHQDDRLSFPPEVTLRAVDAGRPKFVSRTSSWDEGEVDEEVEAEVKPFVDVLARPGAVVLL